MDELQKIQEALDSGFSKEEIRARYLAKGLDLPDILKPSQEEMAGRAFPKSLRLGMTAAQGPTLGFADELAGLISAPFLQKPQESLSEAYARGRDIYRAGVESYKEEQPIGAGVAQGVASLPLGMLNIAKTALPALSAIPRASVAGATSGAISGAGEAKTIGEVPEEAAKSAVVSGVLSPVAEVGMKMIRPVKGAVTTQVARMIPERVKDWMNSSSSDIARRRIAEAMLRDGATPDQVTARLSKLGDDAVIADAAGMNLRDLLDTYATLPGRTKNLTEALIRTRQAERGGRIAESAQRQLSPGNERLADTVENLITKRQIESAPFYDQLRKLVIGTDSELVDILKSAEKLGAFSEAKRIATAERTPFTLESLKNLTSASATDIDLVKRGIDTLIDLQTNPSGKMTTFGRSLTKLKNDLLAKVDDATIDTQTGRSIYKQARDAFAGPSQLIDAAELGRTVFAKDAVEISRIVRGMSQSEYEAFQIGAYENLRSLAGTQAGQTRLMNMWKEPATKEKLKEIFPSERAYREFASDVAAEARKKQIEAVGRGSQTAAREARIEGQGVDILKDVGAITAASKTMDLGSLLNMIRSGLSRTIVPENVRNEIGRILTSTAQSGDELRMIREALAQIERERLSKSATSGIIGTQLVQPIAPVTEALRSLLD